MLDYSKVQIVEDMLEEADNRDAMIKHLIENSAFEVAYYLVCRYITKRNVMELHKSIISNIAGSKSTLDLAPRGFGKSTVGDVDYCITNILRDPNIRIMIGSKTQTQAEAFLKEVRSHFEQNVDLIRIFGDWRKSKDNVWNDARTCEYCRADNKKHYKRGEEPTLPRHPNCRCVYIPVVSDEFGDNELNELTGSVRGAENYEKWKEAEDEKIKQAQLLKAAEDKKLEVEDAEFDLAYLEKTSGTYGNGVYSGIWKDDVTLQDYTAKKGSIQAKRDYFEAKLKTTTGDEYDKFAGLLSSLDDFEEKGKEWELQSAKVKALKKELEEAQKKAGIWVDNPYSQERKDAAYWFKSTEDADTVLRGVCGDVWRKAAKDQKYAAWDYTAGSGKFNRPLTGHAGSWYNNVGTKKVSLDYEGAGEEIRKMTTLIDKSEYDFDIWLQRGCGSEAIESMLGIKNFSSMTEAQLQKFVGKGGRQYNFISTGVAKGKGFSGDVICNIYAPKGTHMIYAEPFSYYSGADYSTSDPSHFWDGSKKQGSFGYESEMIIQRGAYYRITKIEKSGYTTFIDMEVVLDKGYDKFQQRGAFKGYGS